MAFTEQMKVSFEPQQMERIKEEANVRGLAPAVYVRVKMLEVLHRERNMRIE